MNGRYPSEPATGSHPGPGSDAGGSKREDVAVSRSPSKAEFVFMGRDIDDGD